MLHFFSKNVYIKKSVTKFIYNPGHNILELYNVLVQIQLTTSKTKRDIQYIKLGIRAPSGVAERLKTQDLRKYGNISKISNAGEDIAQRPVSLPEIKLWQQQSKNSQKQISNFSCPVLFYCISLFCSKYFVQDCRY